MARQFISTSWLSGNILVTAPVYAISLWVKQNDVGAGNHRWVTFGSENLGFRSVGSAVQAFINGGAGGSITTGAGVITTGQWDHYFCAVDFTGPVNLFMKIFKNGSLQATSASLTQLPTTATAVVLNNTTEFCDGQFAEVAIWETGIGVAGAIDINALVAGLSPLKVRPDALRFYAPLTGDGATEIDVRGGAVLSKGGTTVNPYPHPRMYYPSTFKMGRSGSSTPPVVPPEARRIGINMIM